MLSRPRLAALVFFAALAVIHTWPLASAPGRLSRNDNADAALNEWIVAWVAHQAPRDISHLWDANIFYPERHTLAYSEPLFVPAAMGAPLFWMGQSPVLVYNVLLLVGMTLTGWAGWLLVWRWTADMPAGLVAGTLIAFNAHTLTRLPQLQAFHVEFLPIALLALDRVLTDTSTRQCVICAATLAVCIVLQGATSYYTLVFTAVAVTCGFAVRFEDWTSRLTIKRSLPLLAAAMAVAVAVLWLLLTPYRHLGRVRELDEVARYSASLGAYLATPARVHYGNWSARWFAGDTALFPGVTSLILALVAIVSGRAFRDSRARMAVALGLAGFALSFGPALPGYAFLYRWLPPLQGIRNAARFGYLAIVGLGILAGFGVALLRKRFAGTRWLTAASVATVIVVNLDAFAGPIGYVPPERIASLHATVREPGAIVVHIPFYPPDRLFRNAPYLLESTQNWRPMLNGYSGLVPDSYVEHARSLAGFPDPASIAALHAAGVTHIFVHDRALRDWTDNETADAVRRSPDLVEVAREGDLTLYRLNPR